MIPELRQKVSLRNPVHFLAFGFGSGLASKMPGTFGSIAAIPLVMLCSHYLTLPLYLAVTVLACILGIWICGQAADDMGVHDHAAIVWDEIAGMMIVMVAVPLSWQTMLAGFVLFRFFDIVKPWPISYVDRVLHGGIGIMLDDVLAGVAALLSVHLMLYLAWLV
ncbi:phosphatidylglycerophosphatase A [Aliiglaciecola sp. LCG003]|uniref:phosphatidylglycerophosphatase A family protein n=1 Tax=Aliiglaciecola sp. LCG003 TaxID=3053655 RepID=UPI002572E3DA|nr:phosphatidylglycerophosphatase A [Aliiglaciecola sp. LCG003]WJG08414.1 phosphatidylglycerophosphatase A [Aliiglaciecola sp. LCG003]